MFDDDFNAITTDTDRSGAVPLVSTSISDAIYNVCVEFSQHRLIVPGQNHANICPKLGGPNRSALEGTSQLYFGVQRCDEGGVARLRWVSLPKVAATFDSRSLSAGEYIDLYSELTSDFADITEKYPAVRGAYIANEASAGPFNSVIAVSGAVWGISLSVAFCTIAAMIFTMDIRLTLAIMMGVVINVVTVSDSCVPYKASDSS